MQSSKELKYYENEREDLIKFIPDNARRILDVGCGTGALGRAIKKKRGNDIEVTGVEMNPSVGDKARVNIDKVIIGDVEKIDLPFGKEYFDCVIYGEILEHLIDPWSVLLKHRESLKQNGCIIASIPNIAHYRIIKMLQKQEWNYQKAGILDRSHLRFFTLKSIRSMFDNEGLEIIKIDHKIGASGIKKFLNKIFFNSFLDYITEQYIIVAKKLSL